MRAPIISMVGVLKRISSIKFALLSPDEIRKMSAIKVITPDTYDDDGYPKEMGLVDPHMGVIEPGLRCKTCGGKVDECPGHFGHIELALPVIHIGYVKEVKKLLQSTCASCGRILLTQDQIDEYNKVLKNLKDLGGDISDLEHITKEIVSDASSRGICPHCNAEQKKVVLDKPYTFREEGHKLSPKEIRERLEKIPDDDLIPLGINPKVARPEWTILTILPVPPVTVRPSITLQSGDRSEDDLTHKMVDILRINQRVRENRDSGSPQLIIEDLWELLQYHITTYFDNQTSGIPPARHRSGRPLKTLVQRLKGKEGRFRSNLSGKRVNFSGRTVISPDPYLSINEVGVPIPAARELTVGLRATSYNIEKARELVLRGKEPVDEEGRYLPGVNYIIRPDGRRIKVTDKNKEVVAEKIEVGFIVERQLQDGDIVLFNRQPSLHRMSMMAHEVRILPGKTFRFNLAVCPPYNADFDGDEMNLHVIQGEEARAEARMIMRVQENILSPRFGGPVIGGIHDHITGMFFLTHKDTKFTEEQTLRILKGVDYEELPEPVEEKDGVRYYSGKDIFSLSLPKDLNMSFRASICQKRGLCKLGKACPDDAFIRIKNGRLISGTIDERAVGAFKGRILDKIAREYGANEARKFLDTTTMMSIGSITVRGFSTGIADEDIPEDAKREIKELLDKAVNEVAQLVEAYKEGTLEQMPGRSLEETLEVEIMKVLGKARDGAGEIAGRYLGLENPAVVMARSGARASMLNLSQMAGSIGQQAVRGERLFRGYYMRTLPHFKRGDLGAEAHGFVRSSYKSGLNPTEYFFHSMGGREGLVDTAVRTSRSGYMQRRLINALEDLKVVEDRSVRNTANTIVQFKYGEDGVDPAKIPAGLAVDVEEIVSEVLGHEYADEIDIKETSFGTKDEAIEMESDDLDAGGDE